jgi:hypothetical protein
MTTSKDKAWSKIAEDYDILSHRFDGEPFYINAQQIKDSCQDFTKTAEKEVRVLCSQTTRDSRPAVFKQNNLFLLPVKNGEYAIVKGEGYIDIPEIESEAVPYSSKLDFDLETSKVGDSEMQHLDYAYATSVLRTFMKDSSLVLTIRGRKYTPKFSLRVGNQHLTIRSVQAEVDAGYEGKDQVVLVEAKNTKVKDTIIRQLYYPFRHWQSVTEKAVIPVFFERDNDGVVNLWQFKFDDVEDYNSISLVKAEKFKII